MPKRTRVGQRFFDTPEDTNFPVRAELVEALPSFSSVKEGNPSTGSG
jgi:hypothetical protein